MNDTVGKWKRCRTKIQRWLAKSSDGEIRRRVGFSSIHRKWRKARLMIRCYIVGELSGSRGPQEYLVPLPSTLPGANRPRAIIAPRRGQTPTRRWHSFSLLLFFHIPTKQTDVLPLFFYPPLLLVVINYTSKIKDHTRKNSIQQPGIFVASKFTAGRRPTYLSPSTPPPPRETPSHRKSPDFKFLFPCSEFWVSIYFVEVTVVLPVSKRLNVTFKFYRHPGTARLPFYYFYS